VPRQSNDASSGSRACVDAVHRHGPVTRVELAEHVQAGDDLLDAALTG
jgi:hypothetical protein